MADWKDDIEKYRSGELTSQESHALEKKALQDPFLGDALDGAESISSENFSEDIAELQASITFQSEERKIMVMERMAPAAAKMAAAKQFAPSTSHQKEGNKFAWPLRIAASILVLVGVFFVANWLMPKAGQEDLVLNKEKAKPAIGDTVSIDKNKVNANPPKQAIEKPKPLNPTIATKSNSETAVIRKNNKPTHESDDANAKTAEVMADAELKKEERVVAVEQPSPVVKTEALHETTEAELKKKSIANNGAHIITGQVISEEDGIPIPGVNVIVKGTTQGAVTDMNGNYQLPEVGADQKLTFSFIGYVSQEVSVANQKDIDVKLGPDVSQLSEIVVTGYGYQKDSDKEPIIKSASPVGGLRAYDKYLDNSMRYPIEALELKIKGKVVVQFTVGTDGSLNDFIVKKGIGHGCDEEVIRLVKEGPAWSPTTEDNVAVETNVLVKLRFDPTKAKK
jgi:TonB family protein